MKLYLLIFALIITSCGSGKMLSTFTEENNAIPKDFGKQGTILLVIKNNNIFRYNAFLSSAFKKNYFGEYLMIDYDQVDDVAYKNKEIYRYVFDFSQGTAYSSTYRNGNTTSTNSGNFKMYHINDRLENKKYENGTEFSAYAKLMKAYAINLEAKRKKINNITSN